MVSIRRLTNAPFQSITNHASTWWTICGVTPKLQSTLFQIRIQLSIGDAWLNHSIGKLFINSDDLIQAFENKNYIVLSYWTSCSIAPILPSTNRPQANFKFIGKAYNLSYFRGIT